MQGEGLSAGIQAPLNPPLVLVLKEGVTDRRKGYTHLYSTPIGWEIALGR